MTLTLIAERLAVELFLPCFYDLGLSRLGLVHPTFRLRGERSNPLRQRRGFENNYICMNNVERFTLRNKSEIAETFQLFISCYA